MTPVSYSRRLGGLEVNLTLIITGPMLIAKSDNFISRRQERFTQEFPVLGKVIIIEHGPIWRVGVLPPVHTVPTMAIRVVLFLRLTCAKSENCPVEFDAEIPTSTARIDPSLQGIAMSAPYLTFAQASDVTRIQLRL